MINGTKWDTIMSGNASRSLSSMDFGFLFGIGVSVPLTKNMDFLCENNYPVGIVNLSKSYFTGNLYNFLNIKCIAGLVFKL